MASYVISSTSSLFSRFLKTPISEIVYSQASKIASYISSSISPNGALAKAFTYVPLHSLSALLAQGVCFVSAAKFGKAAYNSSSLKRKVFYTASAITALSLGLFEMYKFRNVISCFNTFECSPTLDLKQRVASLMKPANSTDCLKQANALFTNCTR